MSALTGDQSSLADCPHPVARAGLRERSKARRHDRILRAALVLFAEQGYERTTIAEIAEAAEVSPRTIAAYFPTKLDIALAYADAAAARAATMLRQYAGEGLLASLDHWLRAEESEHFDPELARLVNAMYAANPELDAICTAHVTAAIEAGKLAFAAELGDQVDPTKLRLGKAAMKATMECYIRIINAEGVTEARHQALIEFLSALIGGVTGGSGERRTSARSDAPGFASPSGGQMSTRG